MFFIHIGQRKTGSTTLQRFFTRNATSLEKAGVTYAEIGFTSRNNRDAARALKKKKHYDDVKLESDLRQLSEESPDRRFLLSSETFESVPTDGLKKLANVLSSHKIYILAYVRNFADQAVSFYNQRTKTGKNLLDFDEFSRRTQLVDTGFEKVERWVAVFGRTNVRVVALDALTGENALVNDALSFVGLTLEQLSDVDPESMRVANTSSGWKVVELFRAIAIELRGDAPVKVTSKRRTSDTPWPGLRRACGRIAADLGFAGEKAQYLTREQAEQLWTEYVVATTKLSQVTAEPISVTKPRDVGERPFLPSVAAIPYHQRARFAELLSSHEVKEHFPKEKFARAIAVISG